MSPLVPVEVDLRDFAFMPLEIRRLLSSETWILGTHEEKCAALCLWGESWFQVPAASLPDNDRILAHLSQAGNRWQKVKGHAMRGWILCEDGRWYHPVVAEKALEAWAKHRKASSRGKAGAAKRWGTGNSHTNGIANSSSIERSMPTDGKGNDREYEKDIGTEKRSGGAANAAVNLAVALRAAGVTVNASHPTVIGWANDGVAPEQVIEAARIAKEERGKARPPVGYLVPIVRDIVQGPATPGGGHVLNSKTASAVAALETLRGES